MWRSAAALLLAGCGEVYFVDPTPPVLERSVARFELNLVSEPVVWLPVIDLFVENSASCDSARAWTVGAIRAAFNNLGVPYSELAVQDLSPDCRQPDGRAADVAAALDGLQRAQAQLGSPSARLVIVYANNIALPPSGTVAQSLSDLRQQTGGALWTISSPQAAGMPDQAVTWTYAFDPKLAQAVATVAAAQLPFQSDSPAPVPEMPLLAPDQLARTAALKLCTADPGTVVQGAPPGAKAVQIDPSQPPWFSVKLNRRLAQARGLLKPLVWQVKFETCAANCDRFYTGGSGDLRRWSDTPGCFLGGR